eukprot:jgi/Mesvir1/5977/Mv00731-RA.1
MAALTLCSSNARVTEAPRASFANPVRAERQMHVGARGPTSQLASAFFGGKAGPRSTLGAFGGHHAARPCGLAPRQLTVTNAAGSQTSTSEWVLPKSSPLPVVVVGATGGVGQLVVSALLREGYTVRAFVRNAQRAAASLSGARAGKLELFEGDLRNAASIEKSGVLKGAGAVICCTGTTAFPSARWKDGNGPENTDLVGPINLMKATPKDLKRFIFITSVGVERYNSLPFSILNAFGVLKYKKMSEEFLQGCGLRYTIIRPSRLTDGPYTSYDLNTLLQATSGSRQKVELVHGDTLVGEASRIAVAEACVQALSLPVTVNQLYSLGSVQKCLLADSKKCWCSLLLEE